MTEKAYDDGSPRTFQLIGVRGNLTFQTFYLSELYFLSIFFTRCGYRKGTLVDLNALRC